MSFEERLAAIAVAKCEPISDDDLTYFEEWRLREKECKVVYQDDDIEAFVIQAQSFDGAKLIWHDHVANVWCEDLPSLGRAILRLAHLIEAVTLDKGMMDIDVWNNMASGW